MGALGELGACSVACSVQISEMVRGTLIQKIPSLVDVQVDVSCPMLIHRESLSGRAMSDDHPLPSYPVRPDAASRHSLKGACRSLHVLLQDHP